MFGQDRVGVDGDSMRSCLLFAVQLDGSRIETVEGLGGIGRLSPLQEAFREHHALQCGFCTPGMLMTAQDLLKHNPTPDRDRVRQGDPGGNLDNDDRDVAWGMTRGRNDHDVAIGRDPAASVERTERCRLEGNRPGIEPTWPTVR